MWWLKALLSRDLFELIGELLEVFFNLAQRLGWLRPEGVYQVLDHDTTLELADPQGRLAVLQRRQTVRFLQDYVVAFLDTAWGDGDLFAEYSCSPGMPVDRFKEGSRYYTLISLREIKRRGDVLHFRIRRVIRNGFRGAEESWETETQHRTGRLRVAIIFPKERPCQEASLVQKNENRAHRLGAEHFRTLEDGRQILEWEMSHPRLYDRYLIKWIW